MNWIVWIQDNLLSLYGAVVGTVALILNFGRFWMMRNKGKRKLKVRSEIDKSAQAHLDEFAKPKDVFSNRGNLVGPIYKVKVINISHTQMHIDDAGLIIRTGRKKEKIQAYIRSGSHGFLSHIEDAGGVDIAPGSRESFSIWLGSEPQIPKVIGCYVVDQMGKEFTGRHYSNGQVLSVPELQLEESGASPETTQVT